MSATCTGSATVNLLRLGFGLTMAGCSVILLIFLGVILGAIWGVSC